MLLILLLALYRAVVAADRPPQEYEVKAAFLLNFTKFIEWPSAPSESTFTICIFGDDPFGPILDQMIGGETVGGRKLAVDFSNSVFVTLGLSYNF